MLNLSRPSLDDAVVSAVSFSDHTLLRGTGVFKILSHGGSVLCNSSGDETTYAMSRFVKQIDVFVSHNWSTPKSVKFRALAFTFNLLWCLSFSLILGVIFMTLQAFGFLPTLDMTYNNGHRYKSAPYNMLVGTSFFLVTIFTWHDLCVLLGIPGPTAFLDKTCIDQVDEERKRRGISSLAAFVRHSNTMVVVYCDTYLRKLWTVYELACFMTLKPTCRLVVVPTILADVVLIGVNLFLLYRVLDSFSNMNVVHSALGIESFGVASYVAYIALLLLPAVMFCKMWRKWMHELSHIYEQATSFSVYRAECFHEGDRPLLHASIATFMRAIGLVPEDAPEEVALAAFDRKVHLEVPYALQVSIGRVGIRYRHACVMFLPFFLDLGDSVGIELNEGETALHILLRIVMGLTSYLAVYPVLVALLSCFMWVSLKLQRPASIWASYITTATLVIVLGFLWHIADGPLRDWGERSTAGLCATLSTSAVMFLLTACLYRPVSRRARREPPHAA